MHFITGRTDFRLDEGDALYVDVIHSNAGVLGTTIASGHTDFWPNGGILQPGCQEPGIKAIKMIIYLLEKFLIVLGKVRQS